jgi:hypothetical protein
MNRLLLLSVKTTKRMAALTEQENVAKAKVLCEDPQIISVSVSCGGGVTVYL